MKRFLIILAGFSAIFAQSASRAQETAFPAPKPGTVSPERTTLVGEVAPEGTFLNRMRGQLRRLGADRWVVVFNPDVSGWKAPPMLAMPCMNLAAMEQIVESRSEGVSFLLSGQVFVHDGQNYFLPTAHAAAPPPAEEEAAERPERAEAAETGEPPDLGLVGPEQPSSEPSVDDLIKALEQATPAREEVGAPAARGAPGLASEGTYLSLQRGRVEQSPTGEWQFVRDNDADQPRAGLPPMTLLPCLNLDALQTLIRGRSEPLGFRLSGRVFVYKGRNYLLPTMYVAERERDGAVTSAQ